MTRQHTVRLNNELQTCNQADKRLSYLVMPANPPTRGTTSLLPSRLGTHVFQRTVLACVPFLRVKTQNDSMAQEQRSPHQNVPNWPFPTIIDNEVESH